MEVLRVCDVSKRFTLHNQKEAVIPVLSGVSFSLASGDALSLNGPSGTGKSSLMKMLYGNYRCGGGEINILHEEQWIDIATASPRQLQTVRKSTLGYISQFLRVIPRVPTIDVVAEPLILRGVEPSKAQARAKELLERLALPQRLWGLSPVTFSGGEMQRVNVARGFAADFPVMLLDEPTASLDAKNCQTVIDLANESRARGTAIIGIFHDPRTRDAICNRSIELSQYALEGA